MATVGFMGPFPQDKTLGPGESAWVDFGESTGFGNCALSVTASPHETRPGTHVLRVDNVNVTEIPTNEGDISSTTFHAGCNVTNNGATTIAHWTVLVGVIAP